MSVIPSLRVQTRPRSDDHMPLTFVYVLVNIILGLFTRVVWNGYVWNEIEQIIWNKLAELDIPEQGISQKGSMYRIQRECVAYNIEYVTYSRGCVAYTVEYVTYSGDMYLACMSSTSFNLRQRSSYIGCESIFGESRPSEHKI